MNIGKKRFKRESGFTLVEIIVVMVVVGILGVVTGLSVRNMNVSSTVSKAAHQVLADVRHCQEIAMTMRRDVVFSVTGSSYTATYDTEGGTAVISPNGRTLGESFGTGDYRNVTISGSIGTLTFNQNGAPDAATESVVISLNSMVSIKVVPETGYTYLD